MIPSLRDVTLRTIRCVYFARGCRRQPRERIKIYTLEIKISPTTICDAVPLLKINEHGGDFEVLYLYIYIFIVFRLSSVEKQNVLLKLIGAQCEEVDEREEDEANNKST